MSNPLVVITYNRPTSGEFQGQFASWTFTFPDGNKMVFGSGDNSRRYLRSSGGTVKASPFSDVVSSRFIHRWDIATFSDNEDKNRITFTYDLRIEEYVPSKTYTRESHVKTISWSTAAGEVERYEFAIQSKEGLEYVPYSSESKEDQRLFETAYLQGVACFKGGQLDKTYAFSYPSVISLKRTLSGIGVQQMSSSGPFEIDKWAFGYEGADKYHLLNSVTIPSKRKDTFIYKSVPIPTTFRQDETTYRMKTLNASNQEVDVILPPTDNAQLAKWKNESTCDERFCYIIVKDADDVADASNVKHKVYVEVRRNLGNYFDNTQGTGRILVTRGNITTTADEWKVIPNGDFFMVVDERNGRFEMWEFDGVNFKVRSPLSGDPRYVGGGFGGAIKVYPGSNFFIIHRLPVSGRAGEIIPVIRKPGSAEPWISLNRSTAPCDFTNKPADNAYGAGELIRSLSSATCLEMTRKEVMVSVAPNYFLATDLETSIVTAFAITRDGTKFEDISRKIRLINTTLQESGFPNNFKQLLGGIWASKDYFILGTMKASSQIPTLIDHRLDVFSFSGLDFRSQANFLTTGSLQGNKLYLSNDYFIQVWELESREFSF